MAETNVTSLNQGLGISSLVVEYPSSQSSMCEKNEELKFQDQEIKKAYHDGEGQQLKNDQILVLIKVETQMNNLNNDQGLRQNEQKQKQREIIYQCPRQSLQQQNKQLHKSMSQIDNQSSHENQSSQQESEKSNPNAPFSSLHEQDQSSSEKSSKSEKDKDQKLYPISQESINNSSSDYPTFPQSSVKYESSIKKREQSNQEQSQSSSKQQRVAFKALSQLMGIYDRKTKKQIKSEEDKENPTRHRRHKVKIEAPRKKQHQKKQQDQQCSSSLSSSSSSSESLESVSSEEQEYSSSSEEICESSSVNKSYRYRNKKSISECQIRDQKRVSKKTYQRQSSSQKVSKKERMNKKRARKTNQQPILREVLKCFDKVPKLINSIEELTSVLKTVFISNKERKEQDKT